MSMFEPTFFSRGDGGMHLNPDNAHIKTYN